MQRVIKNYAFGPQERLACLLSKAHLSAFEKLLAHELLKHPDFTFKKFESIVEFNGVSLLVRPKLSSLNIELGPDEKINRVAQLNATRRSKFLQLLAAFNAQNIPVYILKGFLLGELVYNNYSYKKMNDIDILIPKEYIHSALLIFNTYNFYFAGEKILGSKAIDFRLHHSPPLINHESNTIIGLHWGLISPLAKRHPTTDIFFGAKTLNIENCRAHMLSFEHNLLHLCIHLPFFKIGLRELADIANLGLFSAQEINWPFFFETARKWRALDAVYRVFGLSDALIPWCNVDVKNELAHVKQSYKNSLYVQDTDLRIAHRGFLIRSRSTYINKIEKHFILFRLSKRYEDKSFHLKEQWRLFFCIPALEKERLAIFSSYFSSRLLWFSLAQDMGNYYLTLITLRNLFSLLKSRIKNLWQRQDLPDPNIEVFRKFMENIE